MADRVYVLVSLFYFLSLCAGGSYLCAGDTFYEKFTQRQTLL